MTRIGLAIAVLVGLSVPTMAQAQPKALGAATCGAATCHNASEPWPNSSVTQREYATWHAQDPHAKAYKTLTTSKARGITAAMGLGSPTRTKLCLDCHSYNPPASQREDTFDQTVGIGCEGCHGPASEWLGVHQAGLYFYQRNVDEGMYPTTDPVKRAELCLGCHMGNSSKFVNHRMFAAGHPRLPFELGFYSWFSEGTPGRVSDYAHFEVDDDYLQRKPWPFGVRVWTIGQAIQMRELMELMIDPKTGQNGLFPEFALFECHSCHNASLDGDNSDGGAGIPRVNDANAFFVELSASLVSRNLASQLRSDIANLRGAAGGSWETMRGAARQLKNNLDRLVATLARHEFDVNDTRTALRAIARAANQGVFDSYYESEQAVLAAGSLVDELERLEELSPGEAVAAQGAVRRGLQAFTSVDQYNPGQLRAALNEAARIATN